MVEKTVKRRKLSNYSLCFKLYFRLMLARGINLNPGLILGIDNDTVWYELPLCNCIVSMTKDEDQTCFERDI